MRTLRALLVSLLFLSCATASPKPSTASAPQPPMARKEPKDVTVHGDPRIDDYFWLRQKGTPEVEAYLRAETAYAEAMTADEAPLREKVYGEMLSRIQETDSAVPFRRSDGYLYYSRTEKGQQYAIHCRKADAAGAAEQVLLDVNKMAEGKKFLDLGGSIPSDDGSLLAYSTDETGFRQYDLHTKDLRSGAIGPEKIARVTSFAWSADGKALFYTTEDPVTKRSNQFWRHLLGGAKDDLLLEEKDERFGVHLGRSRSKELTFLITQSDTANEVRFFPSNSSVGALPDLVLIQPRETEQEYTVEQRGDLLYIRTNSGGRNFRLVTTPISSPHKASWKEIVPHRDEVMLQSFDLFKDYLVLYEREGGLPQISLLDFAKGTAQRLKFPEADYLVSPDANMMFDQKAYRISYQSLITPPSIIDVDMSTQERKVLKQQPVPGYDPAKYEVERFWVAAADGAQIPVAMVHKKGLVKDGKSPLYLNGYGSYGISYEDRFSSAAFSLIDRGVTFAIAHIRGGGEMGKKWHDAGRMMNKKNTFSDFIAVSELLIKQGYTSSEHLAIQGGSAGGLLMGAVLNMRPELFKVAYAAVPFVDVVNTMLDESLPLTVEEFEEWGNPKKPDEYAYIRSYSPYDNVAPKAYPTILVRSSYNDSQVGYWEPAKWVARLRVSKTDNNPLLFRINMDPAGHGGASGRYDRLRDTAWEYTFLLTQLGVAQ